MTPNNGADRAWGDVADGFWGSSYNPNRSHFGGPAIVAAAEYLQDISVAGSIFKQRKAEQDQKSVSPRPPQKPATVIGPNGEIPGDGDLIVSSIYEGASNATRFNLITEANPIHLVTRLRAEENLPIAGDATFWQAGLGPSSVGIIHQRSRTYYTFGRGLSVPTFSFQMGKYVSSDPIQEGLTPISFSGGAVLVGNFSVVPFFRKAQSTAWGTPQLSLGPSFTFRLDSLDTWSVLRATQMNRSLFQ